MKNWLLRPLVSAILVVCFSVLLVLPVNAASTHTASLNHTQVSAKPFVPSHACYAYLYGTGPNGNPENACIYKTGYNGLPFAIYNVWSIYLNCPNENGWLQEYSGSRGSGRIYFGGTGQINFSPPFNLVTQVDIYNAPGC